MSSYVHPPSNKHIRENKFKIAVITTLYLSRNNTN